MNSEMAPSTGLDPAIALVARLRRECRADIVDVNSLPQGVTIHLAIPRSGLIAMNRLRRDLWMAFVSRNVETRRTRRRRWAAHRITAGNARQIPRDDGA